MNEENKMKGKKRKMKVKLGKIKELYKELDDSGLVELQNILHEAEDRIEIKKNINLQIHELKLQIEEAYSLISYIYEKIIKEKPILTLQDFIKDDRKPYRDKYLNKVGADLENIARRLDWLIDILTTIYDKFEEEK